MITVQKQKYFIFMDESGNNTQDRFFVLGILIVRADEVAKLFNFLENISSKIKNCSRDKMTERIDAEYKAGNVSKIIETAKSTRSFEMKFKVINKENDDLYIHILHKYFTLPNVQMCVLVFDKQDKLVKFSPDGMSHWERYLNNAAMLIANNVEKLPNAEFVILADQITQPDGADDYENTLINKIKSRLEKKNYNLECIWGALRIESHSSTFLQLVDIFVGAIRYDFTGIDKNRKMKFMKVFREKLGVSGKIQSNFNKIAPNYFSVWKYRSR